MIILELTYTLDTGAMVCFHGRDEFSQGFTLGMPGREWTALGRPKVIQFIVSAEKLSVDGDGVVHERRP